MSPIRIPEPVKKFNDKCLEKRHSLQTFLDNNKNQQNKFDWDYDDMSSLTDEDDLLGYVRCHENGCSFRGPVALLEVHSKTIHDQGLFDKFNLDDKTWIMERKKNAPKFKYPIKNESNSIEKDTMKPPFDRKYSDDILGLGEAYGSSDDGIDNIECSNPDFIGLPKLEEIPREILFKKTLNKFKFPISPAMEVFNKRETMMSRSGNYRNINNVAQTHLERPRINDVMFADEMRSDKNVLMQCFRYLVNKKFYDETVEIVCGYKTTSNIQETENSSGNRKGKGRNDRKKQHFKDKKGKKVNKSMKLEELEEGEIMD